MLPKKIKVKLDQALASSDPARELGAIVRSLKAGGMEQYRLYRLLGKFRAGLYDPRNEALENAIALAWGAPWALGLPLFERPLVETAASAARDKPYSVNEVVEHRKKLDGQPVRVRGLLQLGMEISALWHEPANEKKSDYRSSLALGGSIDRWLRLREFEGRPVEGAPALDDVRAVALWIREYFGNHHVEITAMVDAKNRGHLGARPAGIYSLSMIRIPSL